MDDCEQEAGKPRDAPCGMKPQNGSSPRGECRLGHVIGLITSALRRYYRPLDWTSKVSSELVKTILRGEAYALSEMIDHAALPQGILYAPCGVAARHSLRG